MAANSEEEKPPTGKAAWPNGRNAYDLGDVIGRSIHIQKLLLYEKVALGCH